jgi:hypothetical protein
VPHELAARSWTASESSNQTTVQLWDPTGKRKSRPSLSPPGEIRDDRAERRPHDRIDAGAVAGAIEQLGRG